MARSRKSAEAAPETADPSAGIDIQDTAFAGIEGTLVVVNAAHGLNLRRGPHFLYDAHEVLPDGAILSKLELPCGASVPGWALVHTGQCVGWVAEQYLQPLEG